MTLTEEGRASLTPTATACVPITLAGVTKSQPRLPQSRFVLSTALCPSHMGPGGRRGQVTEGGRFPGLQLH